MIFFFGVQSGVVAALSLVSLELLLASEGAMLRELESSWEKGLTLVGGPAIGAGAAAGFGPQVARDRLGSAAGGTEAGLDCNEKH